MPVKVNVSAGQSQFPEGSDISIVCTVDGYPIPRVLWYKDDKLIQTDNRIKISGKATINNDFVSLMRSRAARGLESQTTFGSRFLTIVQSSFSELNRLVISDSNKEDSGRYRCEATNEYSTDANSVDIHVDGE